MLLRLSLQSGCSNLVVVTLERASVIPFSFLLNTRYAHHIVPDLRSSLSSLRLDVAIVFFQMLVNSW